MSWGFEVPATPVAGFPEALTDAESKATIYGGDGVSEQVSQAMQAAKAIVESGAVGTGTVKAYLSGHSNPGHVPLSGYANDEIRLTITCAD